MDRALALRDVMDHVVDVQKEMAKPSRGPGPRTASGVVLVLCIGALALSVYSWFARPEFIWGPKARTASRELRSANVRTVIFLLSRRLEAYREANGSYPPDLASLGDVSAPGVTYTLVSAELYRLSATGPGGEVVYQSDQPAAEFIGTSMRVLGGNR